MIHDRNEWDHDDNDGEEWSEDDDSDDGYLPCPHCGKTMLEAADFCPACDRWITSDETPKQQKWWVVAVVVILIVVITMSAILV